MRARTALWLLIVVALAIFAGLNWSVVTAPTPLSFVFARVEAPLGVILLGVSAGITALYALFLMWIETAALLETRRSARELQTQRQLAESAEASRYQELRTYLQGELAQLQAIPEKVSREVIVRLDQVENQLKSDIERTGNTLAAYLGELEDRLSRGDQPGA
jgi:uncharacterized integral membrane protein